MRAPDRDAATVGMIDTSGKQFVFIVLAEVGLKVFESSRASLFKGAKPISLSDSTMGTDTHFPKVIKASIIAPVVTSAPIET